MKEIPLTKGQVALVDDEDYERINAHKWCARLDSKLNSYYAVRSSPRDENDKQHMISMHREIMNAQPGEHARTNAMMGLLPKDSQCTPS